MVEGGTPCVDQLLPASWDCGELPSHDLFQQSCAVPFPVAVLGVPLEDLGQCLGFGRLPFSHHRISQGYILKKQAFLELITVFRTLETPALKGEPGVEEVAQFVVFPLDTSSYLACWFRSWLRLVLTVLFFLILSGLGRALCSQKDLIELPNGVLFEFIAKIATKPIVLPWK